jgi:hypothetical protein
MGIKSTQIKTHDAITAASCNAVSDVNQSIREEYFDLARIFAQVVVDNYFDEIKTKPQEVCE